MDHNSQPVEYFNGEKVDDSDFAVRLMKWVGPRRSAQFTVTTKPRGEIFGVTDHMFTRGYILFPRDPAFTRR